jgi:hypothetical protein
MSVKQARESRTPDRVEETGVGPAAATPQAAESSATPPRVRGSNGRFLRPVEKGRRTTVTKRRRGDGLRRG